MLSLRRLPILFALLCCAFGPFAGAQSYTSIVIFGDSLCDTGNDAYVSATTPTALVPVPSPYTGYTQGRFTDGTDTSPAAHNYYGVWIEQLAAMFPNKPIINYSLNPAGAGLNYAYGFATTNTSTTQFTYGPGNALSFYVNNMATQVASYLATNPTITNKTLFVVWGGANDLINATSAADIQNAAMRDAGIVQTLINAGATDFIIPNLPPLGLVPRFNGSAATSVPATAAATGFNQYLAAYLAAIPAANPTKTLHLYPLDTYTMFNTVVAAPALRGFTNVTAMSQGNTTINPDTYLFWDSLHPTTYGHNLLANTAMTLLGTPISTGTTLQVSNTRPNQSANVTLTAQVTGTAGIPMGTVSFLDSFNGTSTVLGSSVVTGNSTTASTTLTTAFTSAGAHNITASFAGANGYISSATAAATTVTAVAPALVSSFVAPAITVLRGTATTDTISLAPQGGYTGTATIACGALPAHFTCSVSPASVSFPGTNATVYSTVTLGTITSASLAHPSGLGKKGELVLACGLLPSFGLLSLAALRRKRKCLRGLALASLVVLFAGAVSLGLTGCSDNGSAPVASPGKYTVPINVTSGGSTTTLNLSVTVQ